MHNYFTNYHITISVFHVNLTQVNCKSYYQQLHMKYLCNLARYCLQAPWGWHDSVETCRCVIICEIIVHLLVIVQNNKKIKKSTFCRWTAVAQWLRCCSTNRKVAGSTPASVIGFLIDIKSFLSHYGPGVDSTSNRNEYQEHFLGVKAAGA